ncbi:MAG: hypothetical protein P9L88_04775, partial [Candidatus Tantalella remota]|nr:hypothetical protein [Candidatus Tantalella remota]
IFARSAPAKGRIERLFRTFQDRVIKEMRLKGIKSVEEGNAFLKNYLPVFNKRFSVEALEKGDLHRPVPKIADLDKSLCIKTPRGLNKDSTVAHNTKLFLVLDKVHTEKVTVEERIDGKMLITYKGRSLKYRQITQRPAKKKPKKSYTFRIKKVWSPPISHPLKGAFFKRRYPHANSCSQKEKVAPKEKGLLLTKT